jgi:hypothetical protein
MLSKKIFIALILSATVVLLNIQTIQAQRSKDTTTCLTRFKVGETSSYNIPMTKFCFVQDAGLNKDYTNGWIMKWDITEKANLNLLFLEMNSTDVEGWLGKEDVSGSVQLVFELPSFKDSIVLTNLSYKSKGLYAINNYGGINGKKEDLNGNLKIVRHGDNVLITSLLNLITDKPKTKQQFILSNNPVQIFNSKEYQEFMDKRDSIQELEKNEMINSLTQTIISRDSIWEIEDNRIKDSLKQNPYKGKFRFWVSDIDKAGYSRITFSVSQDSVVIKEGPYDFIYLAKNYSRDSVYFKRSLTQSEKTHLSDIENRINFDTLKNSYTNFCIMDGLILSFSFESAKFFKDVTVSNYYNESIANVVEFINKIVPKKYRIWYDKKVLLKQQKGNVTDKSRCVTFLSQLLLSKLLCIAGALHFRPTNIILPLPKQATVQKCDSTKA